MTLIRTKVGRKVAWTKFMAALACIWTTAGSAESTVNADILSEVQRLYGINQEQAIERLASEAEAAEQYAAIRNLGVKGYAGAWFDAESSSLTVALTRPDHSRLVAHIGATVIEAKHTLAQLESAMETAIRALSSGQAAGSALRRASVDVRANKLIIEVAPGRSDDSRRILEERGVDGSLFEVRETFGEIQFTGFVRGADTFRNEDFEPENPTLEEQWRCSIGASVVGGFITAGHCGITGDTILRASGASFGTVANSSYQGGNNYQDGQDGAWVSTTSSWIPKPQVNGYNDGTLLINPEWSGYLSAPIGGTVCRYGQTTGGPDCGTVADKNSNISSGFIQVSGMTEACGIQSQVGDSGGPYLTGSVQMQGTNSGTWSGTLTAIQRRSSSR